MADFELRIETDTDEKLARLKLFRADGDHLGSNEIRLPEHSSALWEGLFDTRRYVQRYEGTMIFDDQTEPATARTLLERLGLFLGEKVLGDRIVRALAGPQRSVLVVRLPTTDEDVLAAAFARVPWEIARRCKPNSTGWWTRPTRRRLEKNLTRRHKGTKEMN